MIPVRILGTFAICFGLVLLGGCDPDSETETTDVPPLLPFPDVRVTVFTPKSADDSTYWEIPFSEWEAQTGGAVDAVVYDEAAGPEALRQKLAESRDGAAVVIFPMTWRSEVGSLFAELPDDLESFDDLNWQDFHKGLQNHVLKWNGDPTFIPLHAPLLLLYYRDDLLAAAERTPPQTWDDYDKLIREVDEWAPGLTAVEPWGDADRTTLFLARSIASAKPDGNFSAFFRYTTGEPMIDSPPFVEGLERSLAVIPRLASGVEAMTADDCLQAVAEGRAAIGIANAFPALNRDWKSSLPEDARIACVPLPGTMRTYDPDQERWLEIDSPRPHRVSLTGWNGLLAGIPAAGSETERRAGWSVVKTLFVTIGPDAFARGRMTPSRLSQSSTPYPIPLVGLDPRAHADAVRDSLRDVAVVPELSVAFRDEFRASLDQAVGRAVEGEQSPADALQAVGQAWEQILESHDREAIRQSYARGLGLSIRQ